MRKKKIPLPALFLCFLALLTAAGTKTLFGPCVHADGSLGSCHWAGQAVFATACLLMAESICTLFFQKASGRMGLYLAMCLTAVTGVLFPGILIDLCGMATMRCRAVMRPCVTILFTLMGLGSLTGILVEGRRGKRGGS